MRIPNYSRRALLAALAGLFILVLAYAPAHTAAGPTAASAIRNPKSAIQNPRSQPAAGWVEFDLVDAGPPRLVIGFVDDSTPWLGPAGRQAATWTEDGATIKVALPQNGPGCPVAVCAWATVTYRHTGQGNQAVLVWDKDATYPVGTQGQPIPWDATPQILYLHLPPVGCGSP